MGHPDPPVGETDLRARLRQAADLEDERRTTPWNRPLEKLLRDAEAEIARLTQELDELLTLRTEVFENPQKWMRWCDKRVLERAEAAEADRDAARRATKELRAYVRHKPECPQAYDERSINWLHTEEHLDDGAMEDCGHAACRAWCRSANPACACGLSDAIAASQPQDQPR